MEITPVITENGLRFVFVTQDRELSSAEIDELTVEYMQEHYDRVPPDKDRMQGDEYIPLTRGLRVDLRPGVRHKCSVVLFDVYKPGRAD